MISKKNITVLIIDDEPDILELMEEEFRYCGYNTLTAMSGNEAVQVLQKTPVVDRPTVQCACAEVKFMPYLLYADAHWGSPSAGKINIQTKTSRPGWARTSKKAPL